MQLDYRILRTRASEASHKSTSPVPRRASAHPEAIAAVRHKYRNSDQMEMMELPTLPVVPQVRGRVEEIDTFAPGVSESQGPVISSGERDIASISTVPPRPGQHERTPAFNVFDRVRWWLLYPRRLEFLLWLVGTILLIVVAVALILIVLLSLGAR